MTTEEMFLAKRVGKQSGFYGCLLYSIKRKGKGTITEGQSTWLWELAWANREKLLRAGAAGIVAEADRRHQVLDFKLRVKRERLRARGEADTLAAELEVEAGAGFAIASAKIAETAQDAARNLGEFGKAAQAVGSHLAEAARTIAALGRHSRASEQLLLTFRESPPAPP